MLPSSIFHYQKAIEIALFFHYLSTSIWNHHYHQLSPILNLGDKYTSEILTCPIDVNINYAIDDWVFPLVIDISAVVPTARRGGQFTPGNYSAYRNKVILPRKPYSNLLDGKNRGPALRPTGYIFQRRPCVITP